MLDPKEELEKKNREEMLKQILSKIAGNKDPAFLNKNKLDELLDRFGNRRCESAGDIGSDLLDDPREVHSEPADFYKTNLDKAGPEQDEDFEPEDNVYAEAALP